MELNYEDHPIAAMFPLLPKEEITEMAVSIARNGQRHPIVIYQGKILDGRNRYRACLEAKVEARYVSYDPTRHGTSVLQFALDENLNRRHLTAGQRAVIASLALTAMQQEAEAQRAASKEKSPAPEPTPTPKQKAKAIAPLTVLDDDDVVPPTQAQMASAAHVSERTMTSAMEVATDTEAAASVVSGEKTLSRASEDLAKKKAKEQAATEASDKEIQQARSKLLKSIRSNCGEAFAQAFIDGDMLKTQKEVAAFVALDDDTQAAIAPLVATGWSVKKAASHVTRAITGSTTLDDLINRAIAEKGALIFAHNGHEIAITKI